MKPPFQSLAIFAVSLVALLVIWGLVLLFRAKVPESRLFRICQQYALVLTAIIVVIVQLSVAHIQPDRNNFCRMNIKSLAAAISEYRTATDGDYPPAESWQTSMSALFGRKELLRIACKLHGTPTGYGFNSRLPLNGKVDDPAHTIMIAETFVDGPNQLIRSENDIAMRHSGPIVAFADGHVEMLRPDSVAYLSKSSGPIKLPSSRFDPKAREYAVAEFVETIVIPYSGYAVFLAGFVYFVYAKAGESPVRRSLRFLVITLWIIAGLAILISYPVFVAASPMMR